MNKINDITEGNIFKALLRLALPIMGTSFVQVAYSMTDMIWVGRIGSRAVAAVGAAGFYTWLASAFILIPRIGAEVGVAQSVGKRDMAEAKVYVKDSIQMIVFLALFYSMVLIAFRKPLIGFFNLREPDIVNNAIVYLVIVSLGMVFYFINPVFTAIFNGYGESRVPFIINSLGLIINMILDPLLILGIGPFPRLEVAGAALATIIAQICVTVVFIIKTRRTKEIFSNLNMFKTPYMSRIKTIIRLGFPAGLQSGMFTVFAMIIARIVARWGPIPIAAQEVGTQIESITWMTAAGFQTAMSTLVGQNYGANKWSRVIKGYFAGMSIMSIIGILASVLLFFAARPVFSIFIDEEETIRYGIAYLQILAFSQLFMCLESTAAGAFNGLGKTIPPSVVGITFNALRIPAALILSSTNLGLNGVWWAISMSSVCKGIVLTVWYIFFLNRNAEIKGSRILKLSREN